MFLRLKNIQEESKGREPGYTAANLCKRTETSILIIFSVTVGRNQAKAGSVDKHACGQACQIRYVEPKIIIIKENKI